MSLTDFLVASLILVSALAGITLTVFGALGLAWFGFNGKTFGFLFTGLTLMVGAVVVVTFMVRRRSRQIADEEVEKTATSFDQGEE